MHTRLCNRPNRTPLPKPNSKGTTSLTRGITNPLGGSGKNDRETGNINSSQGTNGKGFSIPIIHRPQERWGCETNNKFEEAKHLCGNSALQNGRYTQFERYLRKGNYMTKVDLKDAYFMIPIAQHQKRLLRFRWQGTSSTAFRSDYRRLLGYLPRPRGR